MAYAKVAYPPTREGGKHTAVDDSAAKKVKGYIATVKLPQLVAVVANSYQAAVKARDALKVTWDAGPNANVTTDSIFASFVKAKDDPRRGGLARAGRRQGRHGRVGPPARGDVHDRLRRPHADGADELRGPDRQGWSLSSVYR